MGADAMRNRPTLTIPLLTEQSKRSSPDVLRDELSSEFLEFVMALVSEASSIPFGSEDDLECHFNRRYEQYRKVHDRNTDPQPVRRSLRMAR